MSFRISWYCVPKKVVDDVRDLSDNDEKFEEKFENFYDEVHKDEMMFDFMTYDILEGENTLYTRLFNNHLECECDLFFGTCNREQLINVIDCARQHVEKFYRYRNIDKDGKCEMVDDKWHSRCETLEQVRDDNQREISHRLHKWSMSVDKSYDIDINPEHKWRVSSSCTYEYGIFDLVHILKTFDFENNYIVLYGG